MTLLPRWFANFIGERTEHLGGLGQLSVRAVRSRARFRFVRYQSLEIRPLYLDAR